MRTERLGKPSYHPDKHTPFNFLRRNFLDLNHNPTRYHHQWVLTYGLVSSENSTNPAGRTNPQQPSRVTRSKDFHHHATRPRIVYRSDRGHTDDDKGAEKRRHDTV